MDILEHKKSVNRTGVFYTYGNRSSSKRQWYCCHGYGQLADRLIQKFNRRIDLDENIVSVEGLNRFYWQGVRGEIVSTWMTSRYRLDEIRDNNSYLSSIYKEQSNPKAQNVLFGFSQGGTTLWRWIHEMKPDFDIFINYAGWIPEDIDLSALQDYMNGKKLIFAYGDTDEYLTKSQLEKVNSIIARSKLDIEIYKFKGGHKVDRDVIDKMVETYM